MWYTSNTCGVYILILMDEASHIVLLVLIFPFHLCNYGCLQLC